MPANARVCASTYIRTHTRQHARVRTQGFHSLQPAIINMPAFHSDVFHDMCVDNYNYRYIIVSKVNAVFVFSHTMNVGFNMFVSHR